MLKIDGLTYKFGKKAAVDCLSFEFTNGVYGLLGPNGSGKTTLMRCITGLYNVKGEHIFYNGKPVEKDKSFSRHILDDLWPCSPSLQSIFSGQYGTALH